MTANSAADPATLQSMIDLIDTTELNTVVLDIKEGYVWYDTNVQFFKDAGAVSPMYDASEIVKTLHDHGIYVIARLVVFNDPIVAKAYPDLAIPAVGGGLWLGADGNPWVNPFKQELWQANIDLGREGSAGARELRPVDQSANPDAPVTIRFPRAFEFDAPVRAVADVKRHRQSGGAELIRLPIAPVRLEHCRPDGQGSIK